MGLLRWGYGSGEVSEREERLDDRGGEERGREKRSGRERGRRDGEIWEGERNEEEEGGRYGEGERGKEGRKWVQDKCAVAWRDRMLTGETR